jgi:hypothetical protein
MRVARKAVYVSIPIEPITQFHENASHNKQAEDPLDFVLLFKAPGWRFEWGKFPPKPEGTADFNFVMRRGAKNELPL